MKNEVIYFIKKVRNLIKDNKYVFDDKDYGNDKTYDMILLEHFGITPNEAISHIKTLNYHLWVNDEKPDYLKDSNAFVFNKRVNNVEAYIKLEIEENKYGELLVIWSFHKDK